MGRKDDIGKRKADHVAIVLGGGGRQETLSTGLEAVRFEHTALPEMDISEVDLATTFLGWPVNAPLLISSMTGGFEEGAFINHRLAEAAQSRGIAFAVGSQRIALEQGDAAGLDRSVRALAPDIPILANLGAAQLGCGYGIEEARRAIDLVGADALILHLNALQEAVQMGGDRDWSGLLSRIAALARHLERPLMVKEVGFGISARLARQLADCGVAAVDVAGAGGTNWALVEGQRAGSDTVRALASAFSGWGIPTADALRQARAACPELPLIGSGGLRTGVDVAKCLRLGADLCGIAAGLLDAATRSTEAVQAALDVIIEQLRIVCFCTGSRTLAELKRAPLQGER